jgi:hypothetical protein
MTPKYLQRSVHPNLIIYVLSALLFWTGCGPQPIQGSPALPVPAISVDGQWVATEAGVDRIGIRHDNGDGVVVRFSTAPEVTLIKGGRPTGVRFTPPTNDLTAITIKTEGPDLLVRLSGQPLNTLTDHPEAPHDPTLTWLRVRPRSSGWRIILDGLGTLHLPEGPVTPLSEGFRLSADGNHYDITIDAKAHTSWVEDGWHLSTTPAVHQADAYPRLSLSVGSADTSSTQPAAESGKASQ